MSEAKKTEPTEKIEKKDIIIVAEDSPPNRKILVHLLEKLGYQVVGCENGEAAWKEMENPERGNIVLVVSDIMMPVMDGIHLLRSIRGSEKYKNLPVLLVTAVSEKEYIVQAKELNVNGYILKPVTFQRITTKLQELFPNKTFPKLAG